MVEKYCVLWYDTGTVSAIDCLYVIETDNKIKYNDVGVSRYKPERYYDRDIGYKKTVSKQRVKTDWG